MLSTEERNRLLLSRIGEECLDDCVHLMGGGIEFLRDWRKTSSPAPIIFVKVRV